MHVIPAFVATSTDAISQQANLSQYYRGILHELIDMGADLARLVHGQATAQAANPVPDSNDDIDARLAPDAVVAFDRISRAIRRTIGLARRLDEPVRSEDPVRNRDAARRRILREVEDDLQRQAQDGRDTEMLHAELIERLDAPDLEDEIDHRPIADIILDIRRDMALSPMPGRSPWKRRSPADVARLCEYAARTGAGPVNRTAGPADGGTRGEPPLARAAAERFFRLVAAPVGA
jgi:hypothetical protein